MNGLRRPLDFNPNIAVDETSDKCACGEQQSRVASTAHQSRTFVSVENDSVLGDVLRLRFHPHLGCEFRGRRMHQRVSEGQGPSPFPDRCPERLQYRVDVAQASLPAGPNYTRCSTSSEQGRVSFAIVRSTFKRSMHTRDLSANFSVVFLFIFVFLSFFFAKARVPTRRTSRSDLGVHHS